MEPSELKTCSNCKHDKDDVMMWSFGHGCFDVCGDCAHQMYQDAEDAVRSELGMCPDDPVTLG